MAGLVHLWNKHLALVGYTASCIIARDNIPFMRCWFLFLLPLTLVAQTPSFEVASIRPANPPITNPPICGSFNLSSESLLSRAESLPSSNVQVIAGLLMEAYHDEVDDFDLPEWTSSGPFAISVKIPPNTSVRTCRKMLQSLLAERFHMVTAVETRNVNRYFLKVAKSGLKLKPVKGPPADLNTSAQFEVKDGMTRHTYRGAPISQVLNSLRATAYTEAFALDFRLAGVDGVVDETGLTGYYDGEFELAYSVASRRNELAESIADALTRQLGLTLELRKAPGKVLVLRSSNRTPTEN